MPDPAKLLTTLRRAAEAFRATAGRRGRFVDLAGAAELLVGGDLHGNVDNFRRILLRADLANHPRRHLVLQEVVHGPFRHADGGDKSHQLLDLIAALKCQFPRQVHFLLGNHELAQWTGRRIGKGDVNQNELFDQGVRFAYGDRAAEIITAYGELFAVANLALRTPNRVFLSHALPAAKNLPRFELTGLQQEAFAAEEYALGGRIHSLVWGSDVSPENVVNYLNKVEADWLISGHIPCEQGFRWPSERHLILDSQGTPASYCLFPTERPLTREDLSGGIGTL